MLRTQSAQGKVGPAAFREFRRCSAHLQKPHYRRLLRLGPSSPPGAGQHGEGLPRASLGRRSEQRAARSLSWEEVKLLPAP